MVKSGGWERTHGQLNDLFEQLGPMPADGAPDDLAMWAGALINPLPGLAVAPEIRPHLLAADSSHSRVAVALSGIQSSIKYMSPSRTWGVLNGLGNRFGVTVTQKAVMQLQGAVPWLVIFAAILLRLLFSDEADSTAGGIVGPAGVEVLDADGGGAPPEDVALLATVLAAAAGEVPIVTDV